KDRSMGVVHIYISPEDNPVEAVAFLKERYTQADIPFEINTTGCQEQDWLNNWKQYFNPIEVGEKILIRPTWRDKYDPKGRVVLNLDPGLAFGTGTHETTRLCLQAVEKYTTPDTEMLDVGCGSGILSVAALLLGAKSAVGVDIDEMAVKTAKENAVLNGVEDRFTVLAGNLTDKVEGKYNVVAANIVADAIIMLSKDIKNYMYDDSVYIMSGIIDTRVDDVLNAIGDTFEIKEKLLENGWCCLVATLKEQK
ncbi:MAG: 50S ribosomal protein L11 methyltransferase, partial [Ruminococcus sp.]|nr:50S ribosomal protein L11 methyltransferase [Ruminococcus sp.]